MARILLTIIGDDDVELDGTETTLPAGIFGTAEAPGLMGASVDAVLPYYPSASVNPAFDPAQPESDDNRKFLNESHARRWAVLIRRYSTELLRGMVTADATEQARRGAAAEVEALNAAIVVEDAAAR